jgi:signal transduction histidine kinase
MIRIADLIPDFQSQTDSDCKLIVDPEISVLEAFARMAEDGCDCIGIDTAGTDNPVILSKEDLLQRLLAELDTAQEQLARTSRQLEDSATGHLELIGHGAKTLARHHTDNLELALANMTEGVIILDPAGTVEKANPPAKTRLGLNAHDNNEAVAAVMDDLGLRELICSGSPDSPGNSGQFRIKAASGRVLQIEWAQMIDTTDDFRGHVLMLRDITDRMAADRAKTEFIAAISHELRTPLTSLQNSVSNILAGVTGKVGSKTRQYLHTMKDDCRRFTDLVNDLLDMAKLEAGSMPINRHVINVVTVITDVIKDFADQAKAKDVELLCKIDGHVCPVYADPQRISQVLWNLVSNAIKYTPRRGRVSVRAYDSGNDVVTVVEDSGTGISADLQKQIFSKFYQISRQAGPGYNGSGLGLAICDGIIAVHGGSIWVESQINKGSKFYFSLPKTNPFIVLGKHLDALAKRPRSRTGEIGLFIINFDAPNENAQELKHVVNPLVSEILTEADHLFVTGGEDMVIRSEDSEIILVAGGKQSGYIQTIKDKIQKITQNILRKKYGHAPILPMLGVAVYPTDSRNMTELEKIARHNLGKMA